MSIYLDNNATTQPLPEVVAAVMGALNDAWGNPSSDHYIGDHARILLENSRETVACSLGVEPNHVVFTSGGSEANEIALNMALAGKRRFACSAVEHSSVMKVAEGFEALGGVVDKIEVDKNGVISLACLRNALEKGDCAVSIQWANSETGVIQPINKISNLCLEFGIPLHVDGAQAIGRYAISPEMLHQIDFVTFTGHKLHAPKGVGVMLLGRTQRFRFDKTRGQEGGLRTGTENLPGIAGLAASMKKRWSTFNIALQYLEGLRNRFESKLISYDIGICINGVSSLRVPNTSNIYFPGVQGGALVKRLDMAGLFCSQTSACLKGRPEPSYALIAMGASEDVAYSSIRFAFSISNTLEEVDRAVIIIGENYQKLLQKNNLLAL